VKKLALIMALLTSGSSAFAAGIDSRSYTCGGLNALIAARGVVYIASPFQGFAVAGGNFCSGSDRLEARTLATSDNPQCAVPYCEARPDNDRR